MCWREDLQVWSYSDGGPPELQPQLVMATGETEVQIVQREN